MIFMQGGPRTAKRMWPATSTTASQSSTRRSRTRPRWTFTLPAKASPVRGPDSRLESVAAYNRRLPFLATLIHPTFNLYRLAGHYIPAFGAYIHEKNANGGSVPLKGVSIGDGWTDPIVQMTATPSLMFNLGLADENQVKVLEDYSKRTTDAINKGNYTVR